MRFPQPPASTRPAAYACRGRSATACQQAGIGVWSRCMETRSKISDMGFGGRWFGWVVDANPPPPVGGSGPVGYPQGGSLYFYHKSAMFFFVASKSKPEIGSPELPFSRSWWVGGCRPPRSDRKAPEWNCAKELKAAMAGSSSNSCPMNPSLFLGKGLSTTNLLPDTAVLLVVSGELQKCRNVLLYAPI